MLCASLWEAQKNPFNLDNSSITAPKLYSLLSQDGHMSFIFCVLQIWQSPQLRYAGGCRGWWAVALFLEI